MERMLEILLEDDWVGRTRILANREAPTKPFGVGSSGPRSASTSCRPRNVISQRR